MKLELRLGWSVLSVSLSKWVSLRPLWENSHAPPGLDAILLKLIELDIYCYTSLTGILTLIYSMIQGTNVQNESAWARGPLIYPFHCCRAWLLSAGDIGWGHFESATSFRRLRSFTWRRVLPSSSKNSKILKHTRPPGWAGSTNCHPGHPHRSRGVRPARQPCCARTQHHDRSRRGVRALRNVQHVVWQRGNRTNAHHIQRNAMISPNILRPRGERPMLRPR